jgi:hypothetical protein
MRVPQVSERIKEAPAQALRAVFAGIGQLLLYTDKLRNKAPHARVPAASPAASPHTSPAEPVADRGATAAADRDAVAEPAAAETPRTPRTSRVPKTPKTPAAPKTPPIATEIRDFDKTGNVRLITPDEARADDAVATAEAPGTPGTAAEAVPPAAGEPGTPAASEPEPAVAAAGEQAPASTGQPAAGPAEAGPPLPNYDELSVASLRARLRNLDVTQVRGLVEYEKAHAGRADVVVMFERRIAKLEAGD